MAQILATPEGNRKLTLSLMRNAVQMGASVRHFEMWHHGQTEDAVTAIWHNEVGSAKTTSHKAQL
jgi:hypothetical protein